MIPDAKEYIYKPGTCNIGKQEINRRFRIGFIGLGVMILLLICVKLFHLPSYVKISLFFPAFYSISGFVQAFKKFCYVYGLKHIASLAGRKKFQHINDEASFKEDRKKAFSIILIVTLSSAALTILYVLLSG